MIKKAHQEILDLSNTKVTYQKILKFTNINNADAIIEIKQIIKDRQNFIKNSTNFLKFISLDSVLSFIPIDVTKIIKSFFNPYPHTAINLFLNLLSLYYGNKLYNDDFKCPNIRFIIDDEWKTVTFIENPSLYNSFQLTFELKKEYLHWSSDEKFSRQYYFNIHFDKFFKIIKYTKPHTCGSNFLFFGHDMQIIKLMFNKTQKIIKKYVM